MALLYSLLVGSPRMGEAVKEFGAGVTFKQRLDRLRLKAAGFFEGRDLQRLRTEFEAICVAAEGFAKRRNEIAYSVVFPSVFLPSFIEDRIGGFDRWALAPPYYSLKDFDDQGFPKYAYTSRELNALVDRFAEFKKRIDGDCTARRSPRPLMERASSSPTLRRSDERLGVDPLLGGQIGFLGHVAGIRAEQTSHRARRRLERVVVRKGMPVDVLSGTQLILVKLVSDALHRLDIRTVRCSDNS
jgi:hypothetical protein